MFTINQSLEKETYELLNDNTIYQNQWCGAIAIDENYNLLFVGHKFAIKVFELKNGALKQLNLLLNHSDYVTSLNLLQKKSYILSGSHDKQIVVMCTQLMSNPKYIKKLKGHKDTINCILPHPINEEMFISSSKDCKIKFWTFSSKHSRNHCYQTITEHKKSVMKLSINQQGNTLISLGMDKLILVLTQLEFFWVVKQKIYLNKLGPNICFITNEMFIFQPYQFFSEKHRSENIWIYAQDKKNQKYYSFQKDIQISDNTQNCIGSFPFFYNHQKRLLIFQNGNSLKIIKFQNLDQGVFNIEQIIIFSNKIQNNPLSFISGAISNDWKYLVTWDKTSFLLQVRKYVGIE
ncbi:unnamed protein product [Paramecium primaurelia]|uniref:Uncharacterized protein n=1 Tax=Paramecium primaurelia TaxID=5886 RepID=A0A8S1KBH8_PARPR|nr:unnamed protein product [Paramecium primaurelia]